MRIAIPATFVAIVVAGTALGLSRPALAADAGYALASGQPVMVAQRNGSNLFALLQDIQRLREQVRQLRGRIQMLEHRIQRNSRIRQRMYQKLDARLTALETGTAGKAGNKAIKSAYMAAFEKLRKGKYSAAIKSFESFTAKYPDNSYSDNAWYWLGQARYVQGDLGGAMAALQTVTSEYPESPKIASTLFRIGVIEQARGNTADARAAFKRIISEYPESDSADMARARLKDMKGAG